MPTDTLQFDVEFRPQDDALEQTLADSVRSAERLEDAVSGSLSGAADDARSIADSLSEAASREVAAGLDLSAPAEDAQLVAVGLVDAADAAERAAGVDIGGGLSDAAIAAGQVADGLDAASVAAAALDGIGIDPEVGRQLVETLDEAGVSGQALVDTINEIAPTLAELPTGALTDFASGLSDSLTGLGDAAASQEDVISQTKDELAAAAEEADRFRGGNEEVAKSSGLAEAALGAFGNEISRINELASRQTSTVVELATQLRGLVQTGIPKSFGIEAALIGIGAGFNTLSNQLVQQTGATGQALDDMEGQFSDLLGTTGANAGQLATIFGTLQRDLRLTGDDLDKLTKGTNSFLKASGGTVGDVRALTQVIHQFGLNAGQTAELQDQLVAVQNRYGGSLSGLLSTIRVAGPILETLGFDPGQIAGLAAQLDQAGIGVSRLAPRLAAFSQQAAQRGEDAGDAFRKLVDEIKNADVKVGNARAFEVFGSRIGPQFASAVRQGVVNLEDLNGVLANSSGAASRKASELASLGGVLGKFSNDVMSALGPIGKDLGDDLREAILRFEPPFKALIDLVAAAAPAFKTLTGLIAAVGAPVILLTPAIETLADIIDAIPEPILALAGAYAVLNTTPFQAMAGKILSIGQSVAHFAAQVPAAVKGAGSLSGAMSGARGSVASALSGVNVAALAASGALLVFSSIMSKRAQESAEMKARVEALDGAIGDLGTTAELTAPKIRELLSKGDEGNIISDGQIANIAKLGATLDQVAQTALALATGDRGAITTLTQQLVDLEKASLAGGRAFESSGIGLGRINEAAAGTRDAINDVVDAVNEQARVQLNQLTIAGKINAQDRVEAALSAGLKSEKEGEAKVRDVLVAKLNRERVEKEGLATADDKENERRGAILNALEAEHALRDDVTKAAARHAQAEQLVAEASRGGLASNEERIEIIGKLIAAGLDQNEAIGLMTAAEKELQAVQDKYPANTKPLNDALATTFRLLGQGASEFDALAGAAASSGVPIGEIDSAFSGLQSSLAKLAPPAEASATAMSALITATSQGLTPQQTMSALLEATGGNAGDAALAVDEYAKGLADTSKAIDGLNPKIGTLVGKLQEGTAELFLGPDAQEQIVAATDVADARKAALEQEKAGLEEAKKARQQFADDDIAAQKDALQNQKAIIEEAAKARGEAADTSAIDLQIAHLKANTDTADLDQQIADIEQRQKNVDAGLERARAALKVFGDEEQAIRSSAALRASDIDQQIAQLQTAKQLAQEQAAARGAAFDPAALDAQIATLQGQRAQISAGLDADIANAQTKSGQVQKAVEDAQGGLLNFNTVLDTFDAQLRTKLASATTLAELRAQGLNDTVQLLFSEDLGLDPADKEAFLNQIAQMSPEERAALEQHSEAVQAQLAKTNAEVAKSGNIFAEPNPEFVDAATARGKDMAKGLAGGVVQGLSDERVNEIIDIAIRSGADPAAVREFFRQRGVDAAKAAKEGASSESDAVGISEAVVGAVEQQMGLTGTTSGQLLLANAQEAISGGISIDAAAAMLAPVRDQLPIEGLAGGVSVASAVDAAIRNSPIGPDAASVLVSNLQVQLPAEGVNGGAGYAQGTAAGMALYPVPSEAGIVMVSSVTQALMIEGDIAGQNYALSVASGIARNQGDAMLASYLMAQHIDEQGQLALEVASPSKKGIKLGQQWAEGVAAGIEQGTEMINAAVTIAAKATAVPLPQPALVGAGSLVGSATGGSFASSAAVQGAAGTTVQIENINVTGTTSATADEVAAAVSRKIGWLGITGRHEL